MPPDITSPEHMNAAFADAFNSGDLANLLGLYEPEAVLRVDEDGADIVGTAAIAESLAALLRYRGRMISRNRFCIVHADLALLRADWELRADSGDVVASGQSAEVVRRQSDGTWRYLIDHAIGASLAPRPRTG